MRKSLLHFFLFILLILGLDSCGYRPSALKAQEHIGMLVSSEVVISMRDPENTVIIKDALDLAVIERFRSNLVAKKEAKTHLRIVMKDVDITPITYDINGYISRYQIKVTLRVEMSKKDDNTTRHSETYDAIGYHVFKTDLVSDVERFNAIKKASEKALDSFVNQIIAEGHIDENQ